MAAITRSSLLCQRRYSTATPVFARAATDSIVSLAKPASTSSCHAASNSAASSSSPRRRCRVRCACSVTAASIAAGRVKRSLHSLRAYPTLHKRRIYLLWRERGMAATPAKPAAQRLDPALVRTALILVVGGLAVVFDTTIVSVALHTLKAELHTSVTAVQWVSTSYLLALGITVPLSAWGLARFGGKRLWLFALAVF